MVSESTSLIWVLMQDITQHDFKKLRQSSGSKPKLNEDRHGGSHSPSNQNRKVCLHVTSDVD